MRSGDRRRFSEMLAAVFLIYGQTLSAASAELWFRLLKDFEIDQIDQALTKHCGDPDKGQFVPKPADVIRRANGTHGERALNAWTAVYWAIVHIGPYPSVVFDDPITHHVIGAMGGWERLCMVSNDELPFKQREFEKAYTAGANDPPRTWCDRLPGIAERENAGQGKTVEVPIMIGNAELCRRVFQLGEEMKPGPKVSHLSAVKLPALEGKNDEPRGAA